MPKSPRPPKYRHYKPKDLAVVRIDGHDHYLGKFGSPESHEKYDRIVAEWLLTRHNGAKLKSTDDAEPLTLNKLILAFWQHVKQRYVKNGTPTSERNSFRTALAAPSRCVCGKYVWRYD